MSTNYEISKRYVVKEKVITRYNLIETHFPVIMEEVTYFNTSSDKFIIYLPSILNKIAYSAYLRKPISVSKNFNSTVAQFFNYLIGQVALSQDDNFTILKETNISGLNFYHLAQYLNYCIDVLDNSYSTIKQKERRLLYLYKQLNNANVIDIKWKYHIVSTVDEHTNNKKKLRTYEKPLDNILYQVHYPPKKIHFDKITNLSQKQIDLLLDILDEEEFTGIRLAVVLCLFGGLRKGEVVNLRVQDLRLFDDKNIMVANIKDRPNLFEGRALSESGVKKPRNQVIFNDNGRLYEYYEQQIHYRLHVLSKNNTKTEALFVNTKGKSLTGYNYVNMFKQLKKQFLEKLSMIDYSEYRRLSEYMWGTHICRGIFTNLCIRRGYARSIDELRERRGDKNNSSSQPYWDKYNLEIQTQHTINIITSCKKYETLV